MANSKTDPISLKANTLWNSAGCMFYLGCQWLTTVFVVTLSPDYTNSGVLAFAMSVGIIFASIALYKIRTFQVSDLNNQFSASNYLSFRLITIFGSAAFCFFYLLFTSSSTSLIVASLLYMVFKADESFSDVIYGIEQRNGRMDYIGKSQLIRGVVSLPAFCLPLYLGLGLYAAIICMAFCCMCVTFFFDLPNAHLFGSVRPSITKKLASQLARVCFPAMVASLFANAIVSVVRQYFGITCGEEALGLYAAVATPAVLIQVAATYLYSPSIGLIAKAWIDEGAAAFKQVFGKILAIMVAIVAVLIVLLSLVGGPLLQWVYGPSIADSVYLFPFVLMATGCIGIMFYINDVLIILRSFKPLLIWSAISLACSIGSAIPLIALMGANGINFAIIFAACIGMVGGLICILKASSDRDESKR